MWEIGSIKMAEQLHVKKGLSEVKPQFRKHIAGLHGWHHGRTIINPKSDYCHILLRCGIRATRRRWKYCIINVLKKLWKARGDDSVPFGGKEELYSCKWSPKRFFIEDIQILIRFSGGTQEEIIIPPRFKNLCTVCSKDQPRTLHSINNIVERFWRG